MRTLLSKIRSSLAKFNSALGLNYSAHGRRIKNMEKFHVIVSDVVNTAVGRIDHNESEILLLQHKLRQLEQFVSFSQPKADLKKTLSQLPEVNYLDFENTFRGSEELIKQRQKVYVDFFLNCQNVLDIGCGRGEFLELLADKQINAVGVDLDMRMCEYCLNKGLQVKCDDVFQVLLDAADSTFDGVFSAQVIEHLEFVQLQNLMHLFQKKLTLGAKVVLETVNPLCPQAHQHFYTDLTHIKPLFPDVVAFLAQSFGLKKHALLFRTPVIADIPDVETDLAQAHLYGDYALVLEK